MSDVEFMTQRNWEQRRHAEEYAARREEEERERQDLEVIRIVNEGYDPVSRKEKKRNRRWMAKAAKTAGRMALVMSAASALAGLELVFPLFGLVAVIFYTLNFELQEGRNGLCQKMSGVCGTGWRTRCSMLLVICRILRKRCLCVSIPPAERLHRRESET